MNSAHERSSPTINPPNSKALRRLLNSKMAGIEHRRQADALYVLVQHRTPALQFHIEPRMEAAFHSDSRFMEFNSSIWHCSLLAPRLFNLQSWVILAEHSDHRRSRPEVRAESR